MRRLLKYAAIAIVPFGIPVAVGVWLLRRATVKNAVIIVREPSTKLVCYRGGRS